MASNNDSDSGCGCLIIIGLFIFFCVKDCGSRKETVAEETSVDVAYNTGSEPHGSYETGRGYQDGYTYEDGTAENNTVGVHEREVQEDPEVTKYKNNSLATGKHPYKNEERLRGSSSSIKVTTSSASESDVVVILKHNDKMVCNTYVKAGGAATFNVPNGTYQIFFYYGKGWNPKKVMPNGLKGGFVCNESFAKDRPQTLDYQILTYELIYQTNGNFMTQSSNVGEVF